jgi:ArsR family transcriptional regulator
MDRTLKDMEAVFKALADSTRLRILRLLTGGELCVCHIYESLALPQPKVSRHLAYLKRAGLVTDRKDGLWVHYRLASPEREPLRSLWASVLHVLEHAPSTDRDLARLARTTGTPARRIDIAPPVFSCCD